MGLLQRVETLIGHLRHEDATLNRENWTTAVDHIESVFHEFASRLEALEAKVHGVDEPTPTIPTASTTPITPTASTASTASVTSLS